MPGYGRPLPPRTRPLRPAPPGARADALLLSVTPTPDDTNGNGYPDLIFATVHLFDRRYPPSIAEDGAIVFRLYAAGTVGTPGAGPIRTWRYEGGSLRAVRQNAPIGVCHMFRPSLLEGGGTDVLPIASADLVCCFEPADGRPVLYAGETGTIQVGRRVIVPQARWRELSEPQPQAPEPASAPPPPPDAEPAAHPAEDEQPAVQPGGRR
jgi:hypothetical protein